jgi:nitrogen fixation protein FixH
MTWTWIEETGKEPYGREEKQIILSVVLDQGQQKRLRKQRALLCKPSRDVDSRKLTLSVVLDQGRQKRLREQRALLCKPKS